MALEGFAERTLENVIGYGVGGAVTPVVEWLSRPLAYKVNSEDPNLALDPSTLAQAALKSPDRNSDYAAEAAMNGLNVDRFETLKSAIDVPPGIAMLFDLRRRGSITDDQLQQGFRSGMLEKEWHQYMPALLRNLLTAADAAMARQQGFVDEDQHHAISALNGYEATDADLLFEMSGLPPGADTAIELLARGSIDETLFAQMIREGHTKTKYIPQMLELRWQPLSASVAAEALIRERITQDEAIAIAEKNRIHPEDFLLWSNMLGRPMATGEALTLVRRGEMNDAEFREVVARSDVRTEYVDDILKLKRVLPPLFQLQRLVSNSSLSDELASSILLDEGYDPDVVHGVIKAAHSTKTTHTRNLAATQIDLLYESGLESRQWANDALIGLGYDANEAEWHLELLDAKRLLAAIQSDLSLIHHLYVTHKIDETEASTNLDQLQLATNVRDTLLQQWTNERAQNVARLTNGQIASAFKYNVITKDDAITKLQANGYTADDALILLEIAAKGPIT